jgi:hypothetical protein
VAVLVLVTEMVTETALELATVTEMVTEAVVVLVQAAV